MKQTNTKYDLDTLLLDEERPSTPPLEVPPSDLPAGAVEASSSAPWLVIAFNSGLAVSVAASMFPGFRTLTTIIYVAGIGGGCLLTAVSPDAETKGVGVVIAGATTIIALAASLEFASAVWFFAVTHVAHLIALSLLAIALIAAILYAKVILLKAANPGSYSFNFDFEED